MRTEPTFPLFDLAESRRHAEIGIAVASENRAEILHFAKQVAREIALSRISRECDADDVARRLTKGQRNALGNAAGGIFKGSEWTFVRYANCQRINAHSRMIRVWRYVG
jgi:hypothetical protein